MNFEKLDDYLLELQNYQEGKYEYRTLTSEFDIKKAIEKGKKIVFLKNKLGAKIYLVLGGVFLVSGLILAIIFSINILIFSVIFGIFGAFGLAFIVTGLFKIRTSFLVLGTEGIVYKLQTGSIKGFKWDEISLGMGTGMDSGGFYNFPSIQINIVIPNGDFIKLAPRDYCSEEFAKSKSHNIFDLYVFTFMLYYKWGKLRPQEITLEEDKQPVKKGINSADLREEYYKYKEKMYKFGKYGTREQILDEFLKGKIFVLKGGLGVGSWVMTSLMIALALLSLFALLLPDPDTGIFIIPLIFILPIILLLLLTPKKFIVIGPWGFYYQKILSSGIFSWRDVNKIKSFTQTYRGFNIGVVVKIYISHGRILRFGSSNYLHKEFPRKVKREMFVTLFYIYSQQGQKKKSQISIQKSVSHSQLKEQILSSLPKSGISQLKTKELQQKLPNSDNKKEESKLNSDRQSTKLPPISGLLRKSRSSIIESELKEKIRLNIKASDMINKAIKILEDIMKNDEEYKTLLARKDAGESVENLMEQNRNYAEILANEDKERSEEALKWGKSEEAAKWFELIEEMRRMNPDFAKNNIIRYKHSLKITKDIEKNEEEYKKLLERKNKGEYVDDLIKQNRYTAKVLDEQNKKVWD
jgi:hypothetical protein